MKNFRYKTSLFIIKSKSLLWILEAFKPKGVNSISNIIGVNSLWLGSHQMILNKDEQKLWNVSKRKVFSKKFFDLRTESKSNTICYLFFLWKYFTCSDKNARKMNTKLQELTLRILLKTCKFLLRILKCLINT